MAGTNDEDRKPAAAGGGFFSSIASTFSNFGKSLNGWVYHSLNSQILLIFSFKSLYFSDPFIACLLAVLFRV